MEAMGGGGACFLDEEWDSLYKIFSFDSDLDLAQLLAHNSQFPADDHHQPTILAPNPSHFPQSSSTSTDDFSGSSNGSTNYVNSLNHLTQYMNTDDQFSSLSQFDHFLMENDGLLMSQLSDDHTPMIERPGADQVDGPDDQRKRKLSDQIEMEAAEPHLPKKRARVSKHAEKGKRKIQQKKKKKEDGFLAEEETNCDSINVENSSCDASDDESNASQEVIKKRASRGAATDPQSLYARRRREKINERLRILQTLVPNGTKVDISTMLEEAVHYVKFLQLQIKLLSSDEMWMYAPLAYNGFDVDFYKRFSPYF